MTGITQKIADKKELQKEVNRLFYAYDKAEAALIRKRDELFPVGTKVRSRIDAEHVTEVIDGSLYPHQVNTKYGHMSWRYLDIMKE